MDVELRANLSQSLSEEQQTVKRIEWPVVVYWGISALAGVIFLGDWIKAWNVGETLAKPWLVLYLIATLIISQVIYFIVARHDNRPLRWGPTLLFAVGNGIFETFAFALVYLFGETVGIWIGNALGLASLADTMGFGVGAVFFTIYGGGIHALFWLKILPPHLNDTPLALLIRKYRLISEIALVLGWCLCFWLTRDIWTVVFFHVLVDFFLMIRVRPVLFIQATTTDS